MSRNDPYEMCNVLRPFDTLDDLIARFEFLVERLTPEDGTAPGSDFETVTALLILAREIKALQGWRQ